MIGGINLFKTFYNLFTVKQAKNLGYLIVNFKKILINSSRYLETLNKP